METLLLISAIVQGAVIYRMLNQSSTFRKFQQEAWFDQIKINFEQVKVNKAVSGLLAVINERTLKDMEDRIN